MNKKLFRKLLRDPHRFFADFHMKRASAQVTKNTSPADRLYKGAHDLLAVQRKQSGFSKYTVVSAVYNVETYLDDYFKTLVNQTLDFRKNIFLILVDDGSTDGSREVINSWQQRFPENITYIYKDNGGQASARNLGLEHVKTEWVTFIDPDDFVSDVYFAEIDSFLKRHQRADIRMVAANLKFYFESEDRYSDSHPLKFKFQKGDRVENIHALDRVIQLHSSSAFFRSAQLAGLRFDERIKPTFEDACFTSIYLSRQKCGAAGFSAKASYFYRKRSDGSSTLDTAWLKPELFSDVLKFGCLTAMREDRCANGRVTPRVQRTVLYHLMWYFRRVINNPETLDFLDENSRRGFLILLDQIFEQIDADTIMKFDLVGTWFYHKVGILHAFRKQRPDFQIVYIEAYDPTKSQIQIRYFTGEHQLEAVLIDGEDTLPKVSKTITHDFLDRVFVQERRIWVDVPDDMPASKLRVVIGGRDARITFQGKQHSSGLKLSDIISTSRKESSASSPLPTDVRFWQTSPTWLFMDRNTQADDNAEHLYRYVMREHPEQRIVFALDRDSRDWKRLSREGFNLVAFGSKAHHAALRGCDKIISSHIDRYVNDYFQDGSLYGKHLVFLQHGVIMHDLSRWLNTKKRIDLFITAARPEYQSICGPGTRYKFTKKEVRLTGLPRHDALFSNGCPSEKIILVAPTWRNNLTGSAVNGATREVNPNFASSTYANRWSSLLNSPELLALATQYGYRIEFLPHVYVEPYLAELDVPEYVRVRLPASESIQDIISRAAFLVTDYSSLAFEFSILKKPVVYYQFDSTEFFSGSHTTQPGYFDYFRDGFGPVAFDEPDALVALSNVLKFDAKLSSEVLERIERFFAYFDTNNCRRVYDAIRDLDRVDFDMLPDFDEAVEQARFASRQGWWMLAGERWRRILAWSEIHPQLDVHLEEAASEISRAEAELGLPSEQERVIAFRKLA